MTLPPATAVADHRTAPASTTNRPPTPKKPVQKRNHNKTDQQIFSPYFTRLTPTSPDFTRHDPTLAANHIPPFHCPYNPCPSFISPRMRPNPAKTPKKRKPTDINRLKPTKHALPPPSPHPRPKFVHNPHTSCKLPPAPPLSVIQFTRTVPYKTLQPFSPAQE